MNNNDKKTNFKDFILEYSFKDVLPAGTQRIYPVRFEQEEIDVLNSIDNSWLPYKRIGKPDSLHSKFIVGKKYKTGVAKCNAIVFIDCYRDRYILNIHCFDDTTRFGSVFLTKPEKVLEPIIIPRSNKKYLTRKVVDVLNKHITTPVI